MKSVVSGLRAAGFSTLLVAIFAFSSQASATTEILNFDNNQLPSGWTLGFVNGPGSNAYFSNGRFEAGPVDTYAIISRSAPELQSANLLTIQYQANISNVFWGMSTGVILYTPSNLNAAQTGLGKAGYGVEETSIGLYGGDGVSFPAGVYFNTRLPLVPGDYSVTTAFRDGAISENFTQIGGANSYSSGWLSTPDFKLANVGKISLLAATTSGDSAWIDNVSLTVSAVPEPETYVMLLIGLATVSSITRKRRAKKSSSTV